jgi:ClpP class serine protease
VDSVAQGRVWTGLAARSRGLVDELGGIYKAIAMATRKGRHPADDSGGRRGPIRATSGRFLSCLFGELIGEHEDEDELAVAHRTPSGRARVDGRGEIPGRRDLRDDALEHPDSLDPAARSLKRLRARGSNADPRARSISRRRVTSSPPPLA